MPSQQYRPQSTSPQVSGPAASPQAVTTDSGQPEWSYALAAGNAATLALVTGNVAADEETAGSLLRGEMDGGVATGPSATPEAPERAAPPTTNPGGVYSKPFQKNQQRAPAAKVALSASQQNELRLFQENWVAHKARYQRVAAKTGVPAELIAAIHYRESSMDFGTYLHQGDKLGKKAVHVPKNIPIFYEWEPAAVHALNMKKGLREGLGMTEDTTDEVAMTSYAEAYNGLGYSQRGVASPYVYAGTDQYKKGLYVSDGKYSKDAKDRRLGVLALTRGIDENGAADVHAGAAQDSRSAARVWDAVLSGQVLRRGQSGREVEELQRRLVAAGVATDVDGDYGPGTEKAVRAFQKANGMQVDGVVGAETAAAIDRSGPNTPQTTTTTGPVPAPTTDTTPAPEHTPAPAEWARVLAGRLTLQHGARGPVVRYLQKQLNKAGFAVDVDGDFGAGTQRAVRDFQRSKQLRADGDVGERTAAALA